MMVLFPALHEFGCWHQSVGGHSGEFTSAFGRAAEVHGPTSSDAFDAKDPGCVYTTKTHLRHWLCTAAMVSMPGLSPINVLA